MNIEKVKILTEYLGTLGDLLKIKKETQTTVIPMASIESQIRKTLKEIDKEFNN